MRRLYKTVLIIIIITCVHTLKGQDSNASRTSFQLVYTPNLSIGHLTNGSSIGGDWGVQLSYKITDQLQVCLGMSYLLVNFSRFQGYASPEGGVNLALLETPLLLQFTPIKAFEQFSIYTGIGHGLIVKHNDYLPGLKYNTLIGYLGIEYNLFNKEHLKIDMGGKYRFLDIYNEAYGSISTIGVQIKAGITL